MEAVRGQDDRKREYHAMDGVWLPAGEENPGARGLPDSRHTPMARGQGGRAFCPLAAPANGRLANRNSRRGGTGSSQSQIPNRRPIATAQGPAPSVGQDVGPRADREANRPPLGPPFQPLSVTGDRSPSGDLDFAAG